MNNIILSDLENIQEKILKLFSIGARERATKEKSFSFTLEPYNDFHFSKKLIIYNKYNFCLNRDGLLNHSLQYHFY